MNRDSVEKYFRRFGFCERQIAEPPPTDLGIVVVVPCFNEPDLLGALESLHAGERPKCGVEIIVVVNSSA
ncbi:MAG TPA: glycosyltransferase, partial [Pyrinomonadaceae bacterium]|nr:glycosyltransferase [Pyrinomonadaceae bacterium]